MTQHELSRVAPNFEWRRLFATLGFADIGTTSPDIVVEVDHTRARAHTYTHTHTRTHQRTHRGSPWGVQDVTYFERLSLAIDAMPLHQLLAYLRWRLREYPTLPVSTCEYP